VPAPYAYCVRVEIADPAAFASFVAWLRAPHMADVCAAGALDAELVTLDAPGAAPSTAEVRYHFPTREAFALYERDHAPRLRADGLAVLATLGLAPGNGCTMTRTTGPVLHRHP